MKCQPSWPVHTILKVKGAILVICVRVERPRNIIMGSLPAPVDFLGLRLHQESGRYRRNGPKISGSQKFVTVSGNAKCYGTQTHVFEIGVGNKYIDVICFRQARSGSD